MEEANTLAHYDKTTITAVKSFIVQAPGEKKWQHKLLSKKFLFIKTTQLSDQPLALKKGGTHKSFKTLGYTISPQFFLFLPKFLSLAMSAICTAWSTV